MAKAKTPAPADNSVDQNEQTESAAGEQVEKTIRVGSQSHTITGTKEEVAAAIAERAK